MTFFTWYDPVQTDQRKAHEIMIKRDILAPALRLVTRGAVLAKLSLMHVIFTVTGEADPWLFHIGHLRQRHVFLA